MDESGRSCDCGSPDESGIAVCQCGTVIGPLVDHPLVLELRDTIRNLEKELTIKIRRINRLQKESAQKLRHHKLYDDAMEILQYWKELCSPKAVELEGERLRKVINRLEGGYSKERLLLCVEGYSHFPYVVNDGRITKRRTHGSPADRAVDAELIFSDARHVEKGESLAAEYAQQIERSGALVEQAQSERDALAMAEKSLGVIGNAALRYASRGWYVFPCKVDAKQPYTRRGLLDAKNEAESVIRFWSRKPDANVAVRTGRESGIVVLDVDGEDGIESLRRLERQHGAVPRTASVVTPRGGQHFYFRHPGIEIRNTQGVPARGLDIRGDGGYVLAPPSRVAGKSYEVDEAVQIADIPKWLLMLVLNHQKHASRSLESNRLDELIQRGVCEGSRNDSLTRVAGWLVGRTELGNATEEGRVLGLLKTVNMERCSPPLPERDVERIFESVMKAERRKLLRAAELV